MKLDGGSNDVTSQIIWFTAIPRLHLAVRKCVIPLGFGGVNISISSFISFIASLGNERMLQNIWPIMLHHRFIPHTNCALQLLVYFDDCQYIWSIYFCLLFLLSYIRLIFVLPDSTFHCTTGDNHGWVQPRLQKLLGICRGISIYHYLITAA